jgi:hypothetical protein
MAEKLPNLATLCDVKSHAVVTTHTRGKKEKESLLVTSHIAKRSDKVWEQSDGQVN